MSDTTEDPRVLDTVLRVILGCLNILGAVTLFLLAIIISFLLLLTISSILDTESPFLLSQPRKAIQATQRPKNCFGLASALLTVFNGFVLMIVITINLDEHKYFWEAFWYAFLVGSVVLGFSVMVQSAIMGLYSCCANGRATVDGLEMEPLADVEAQQDEASFEFKA
jgi:hypothetical protein